MTEIRLCGPDARGLTHVTLNRPEARNALNLSMCKALKNAFDSIVHGNGTRAVLLSANGPVFCAGADLKERKGRDRDWVLARRRASFTAYDAISACPVPVVAVLDGPVIGSGGEIAMSCDFALASFKAHFRWPEVGWGAIGATQRLPRRIGVARAKELIFSGRKMSPQEALSVGLIARLSDNLDDLVTETFDRLLTGPPLAMRLTKSCIDLGLSTDLAHGIEIEMEAIEQSMAETEWQEGLTAFAKLQRGKKR